MQVRELKKDNWADFEKLMQSERLTSQCYCLNHRVSPQDLVIEEEACQMMKSWVCASGRPTFRVVKGAMDEAGEPTAPASESRVNGLILYDGNEPVGWIGIDPLEKLPGHDAFEDRRAGEWTIHCVYLTPPYRGKNYSQILIRNALELARSKGAQIVTAYPCPHEYEAGQSDSLRFGGRIKAYLEIGFTEGEKLSDLYQRVEFKFDI